MEELANNEVNLISGGNPYAWFLLGLIGGEIVNQFKDDLERTKQLIATQDRVLTRRGYRLTGNGG